MMRFFICTLLLLLASCSHKKSQTRHLPDAQSRLAPIGQATDKEYGKLDDSYVEHFQKDTAVTAQIDAAQPAPDTLGVLPAKAHVSCLSGKTLGFSLTSLIRQNLTAEAPFVQAIAQDVKVKRSKQNENAFTTEIKYSTGETLVRESTVSQVGKRIKVDEHAISGSLPNKPAKYRCSAARAPEAGPLEGGFYVLPSGAKLAATRAVRTYYSNLSCRSEGSSKTVVFNHVLFHEVVVWSALATAPSEPCVKGARLLYHREAREDRADGAVLSVFHSETIPYEIADP